MKVLYSQTITNTARSMKYGFVIVRNKTKYRMMTMIRACSHQPLNRLNGPNKLFENNY